MPRKNNNAGQPNRSAQIARRADRRVRNEQHKKVHGPSSEFLLRTQIEYVVAQKVSA